jgi:hypothetical protein
MVDDTENVRRHAQAAINRRRLPREQLELEHGQVWNAEELTRDFEVIGFMAPVVAVTRKSDGAKGSMLFQHEPRLYVAFQRDDGVEA